MLFEFKETNSTGFPEKKTHLEIPAENKGVRGVPVCVAEPPEPTLMARRSLKA